MIDNPNLIMVTLLVLLYYFLYLLFLMINLKEPLKLVAITFILGLVITIPVIFSTSH